MASLKNLDYHSNSATRGNPSSQVADSKGLQRFQEALNDEAELNSPDLDIIHLC